METDQGPSLTSIDIENEPVSEEEAERLMDKHMRGEALTDGEQSRFDRVFVSSMG